MVRKPQPSTSIEPAATVLFVNNAPEQSQLWFEVLSAAGLVVRPCRSAEAALDLLKKTGPPALLITDIALPGIDGWQLCRLLRSEEYGAFNRVPLIVASSLLAGYEAAGIAAALGVNAFLRFPEELEKLAPVACLLVGGQTMKVGNRLLIVEDQHDIANLLRKIFRDEGYTVDLAGLSSQAIEKFALNAYDFALIDYHLPDANGDQLLVRFRNEQPDCICIMVTADTRPELALDWMLKGAADYIRKPFSPKYLLAVCARCRRERAISQVEKLLAKRTVELRTKSAQYQGIFHGSPDGLLVHDQDGMILDINETMARRLGLSRDQLLGRHLAEFVTSDAAAAIPVHVSEVLGGRASVFETVYVSVTGETLAAEVHERSIPWVAGRQAILSVSRDISERKILEEKLLHAEKMQVVGQLAAGVAHDFNNQLSGVMGYADLLQHKLSEPKLREYAEKIVCSAKRAANLTAQLLAFSRKERFQNIPVDLHRTIAETVSLIEPSFDRRIRIRQTLYARPALTMGDPGQLQNALLNLAINARDAMPAGGELVFVTNTVFLDDAFCCGHADQLVPGEYLELTVTDTGCGMSPEVKEHIFEPFFTTKGVGEGVGMGLPAVYGTVLSHKGDIVCRSKPGEGTSIFLYLPLYRDAETAEAR